MMKLRYITTVGDLVEQLSKFDKNLPILALDPAWASIDNSGNPAEIKVFEGSNDYNFCKENGVIIESKFIESSYSNVWTTPAEVEEVINYYAEAWGKKYKGLGTSKEEHLEKFNQLLESFRNISEYTYNVVLSIFIYNYQKQNFLGISGFTQALKDEGAKDNLPKILGEFICANCICGHCSVCPDGCHCNGYTCNKCKENAYTGYDWYCDE